MTSLLTLTVQFELAEQLGETILGQAPGAPGPPDEGELRDDVTGRKSPVVSALSAAIRALYVIKRADLEPLLWEAMPDGQFHGLDTVLRMRAIRVPIDKFEFQQAASGVNYRVLRQAPHRNFPKAFIDRPTLGNRVFMNTGTDYPKIRRVLGPSLWSMVSGAAMAARLKGFAGVAA
ncbi:MAG: hypothetical protein AB7U73_01840 [Pirellulales bacterium]